MSDRPPFDPSRIRVPPAERTGGDARPLTPTQLNELVRGAVTRHLAPTLHVVGEIGNLARPGSGHLYFTLKDDAGELRAVMWRSDAQRLKFEPRTGMEVIATGGVEVYVPRGTYQLQVRRLEPRGVGALELAFRQLCERLAAQGLFDPLRKRPLPRIPARIGLVTSPSGAALRDVLHTLARRFPAVEVCLFPCRVQGDGAAEEIAAAIRALNRAAPALGGIHVAIVGRGGGSQEDLWAFNEEIVARAIFDSAVPIVSAVGHEVDVTIADLVADVRAATPTAAAELVAPRRTELLAAVQAAARGAERALRSQIQLGRQDLGRLTAARWLAQPAAEVRARIRQIDEAAATLRAAFGQRLSQARAQLVRTELAILRFSAGRSLLQLEQRLERAQQRVADAFAAQRRAAERRLATAASRLAAQRSDVRAARLGEALRQAELRLQGGLRRLLQQGRRELDVRLASVEAAHPRAILRRGFAVVRDARSRRVLRTIAEVHAARRLALELGDGEIRATADDPRQPRLFD